MLTTPFFLFLFLIPIVSFTVPTAYADGTAFLTPTVAGLDPACTGVAPPFCTIQAALDAGEGPIITIKFAAYNEILSIDSTNDGVTLLGQDLLPDNPDVSVFPTIQGEITFSSATGITGFTIENLQMAGGISVTSGDVSGITLKNNIFSDSPAAISITPGVTGTLDAENNYWGHESGPDGVGGGIGNSIDTNVDYSPFCTNPACSATSNIIVDDDGTNVFTSIQTAIGSSSANDIIEILEGNYDESFTISKPLTLNGPNAGINPVTNAGGRVTEAILTLDTASTHLILVRTGDVNPLTIDGLTFENVNTGKSVIQMDGTSGDKKNIHIINNRFINNDGQAVFTALQSVETDGFQFNNNVIDTTLLNQAGIQPKGLTDCQINGNRISHTTHGGINADEFVNCEINNNIIDDTDRQGIQLANSPSSNTVISGNTITNTNTIADAFQADRGGITIYPNSNDIIISGNTLTNNFNGFAIRDKNNALASDVILTNNKIFDNAGFGAVNKAQLGGTLNAKNNYWGHPTGPNHVNNPAALGNQIEGDAVFTPWFTNEGLTILSFTITDEIIDSTDQNLIIDSPSVGTVELPTGTNEIVLSDDTLINLISGLVTIPIPESIPLPTPVIVEKEVTLSSENNQPIQITNQDVSNVVVTIPDTTLIQGAVGWDGQILPPKEAVGSGKPPTGFRVGDLVIEVGSPDSVLILDKSAEILLAGVTGAVGYKPALSNDWVQITEECDGDFTSPIDPTAPGECFISDGTDTKIITFHFTTFGPLVTPSSGGGGGDATKPVLEWNSFSDSYTLHHKTNEPVELRLSFYENTGTDSMTHVGLFTNIRDFESRYDSELSIEWDKGQPLNVFDPNEYLKSANVITEVNGTNLDVTFHLIFGKPMETSDIEFYYWDVKRNGVIERFVDTLEIIQPVIPTQTTETIEPEPIPEIQEQTYTEETDSKPLPKWFDNLQIWLDQGLITEEEYQNAYDFVIKI